MSKATRPKGSRPTLPRMLELVDMLDNARVSVAGDAVLDTFIIGEIARVSREAPVLILDHRDTQLMPGGAGNTAANLASLDVTVALIGRIGQGENGRALVGLLEEAGIGVSGIVVDPKYTTPTKTRILAGSPHTAKQQVVRLDRGEGGIPLPKGVRRKLVQTLRAARRDAQAILFADYGYGSIDPDLVLEIGDGPGPLTLDSRFALASYRGVDAATPNLEEIERAAGRRLRDSDEEGIAEAGRQLRKRLGASALIVTRGSWGMTLVESRRQAARIPVFGSDDIADVTGAGDTVIAVFTASRASGASWREAAELANVAGGLVVMKRGTATLTRDELRLALVEDWS